MTNKSESGTRANVCVWIINNWQLVVSAAAAHGRYSLQPTLSTCQQQHPQP